MIKRKHHQSGFSLLELLLAMGVFFALLIAVFVLLQGFAQRESARATNKYMATVASAMKETLSNIDNYNALYQAAMAHGGGYELVADTSAAAQDNITQDFTISGVKIQASRQFNSQFRSDLPIRGKVRILLRIADNMALTTDTPALDIILISSEPRPGELVRRTATEAGPNGGFIDTYTSKAAARITSAFGTWSIDPNSGLQNTNWYTTEFLPAMNSQTNGLYLAYYMYQNIEDVGGDYLYRTKDVDPALKRNTMYGDFNIGGNDIFGGDDVNVGNFGSAKPLAAANVAGLPTDCEGDVVCVNSTAAVKGSAVIGGTLTTTGSALIADSSSLNKLRIQNGLSAADKQTYNARSEFVVDANANEGGSVQDEIDVTGNATFVDGATVKAGTLAQTTNVTLTMPDLNTPGQGILTTNTIDARRISATTVSSKSLTVDNQLRTGIINNGDVTVQNGTAGVIDITASRDLVFGAPGRNRTITAPAVNIKSLNISNFGTCNDGCAQ